MPKLTKRDIVVSISNQTGLVQHQVFDVVQRTLDKITDSLAQNIPVELRNFGVFQPRLTKPRVGRNPNQPGSSFVIPPRATVKFKAGKIMRQRVEKLSRELKEAAERPDADNPVCEQLRRGGRTDCLRHESTFSIVFCRRSKLIGLVRCSEKPACFAWSTSCSLPNPLSAMPGKSFLRRTSRIRS
jgi:nucleoid DNA-binding protein